MSPEDVLDDARLSIDEKRLILSSWASDMYVVESQPAFREMPGIPHKLRLDWPHSSGSTATMIRRHEEDWHCGGLDSADSIASLQMPSRMF